MWFFLLSQTWLAIAVPSWFSKADPNNRLIPAFENMAEKTVRPTLTYDDEAHRLNMKSGLYGNIGENQIKEIINASKISVFFIDEDQIVTMKDVGTIKEIKKQAKALGSTVHFN